MLTPLNPPARGGKKPRRPAAEPARRVKATISMDISLHRRLKAYCGWNGLEMSAAIAAALEPVLAGFVVSHRSSPAAESPPRLAHQTDQEAA